MADLVIADLPGQALASVMLRRGATAPALGAALGFAVAPGPVASGGGALMLWGTGPGQWLAHAPQNPSGWAEGLGATLDGLAAVVEQSGAYALWRLSGGDALRLLQKGLPIDLAPHVFAPGAVAVSAIAHIGVIVHHAAPGAYYLAVFRSFANSLRAWIETSRAGL